MILMYSIKIIDGTFGERALDLLVSSFPYNFESNSIAELKDASASWSYNITLPRTANNDNILGFAGSPFVNSAAQYKRLLCNVYSDGVLIINHGVLFIDSTTDSSFKVQILSGVANVFELMKDLSLTNDDDWFNVNMPMFTLSDGTSPNGVTWRDIVVSDDRSIRTTTKKNGFLHYATPLVNVGNLVQMICNRIGYSITYPAGMTDLSRMYLVPTKRANFANATGVIASRTAIRILPTSNPWYTGIVSDFATTDYNNQFGALRTEIAQHENVMWTKCTATIGVVSPIFNNAGSSYFGQGGTIRCGGITIDASNWQQYRIGTSDAFSVEITDPTRVTSVSVSCDNAQWRGGSLGEWVTGLQFGQISFTYELTQTTQTETPFPGARFPIMKNLGYNTAQDLFKMVCQAMAFFVIVDPITKTIACHTMTEVVGNKSNAADWTLKLSHDVEPETQFEFGNYYQKNNIVFNENKVIGYTDTSSFAIANEKLPAESDVLKIPLTSEPSRTSSDVAIFQAETTSAGLEYKHKDSGTPVMLYTPQFTSYLYHFGSSMVLTRHQSFIDMLQNTRVVTATFVLDIVDILNFDVIKPVFLRQFGAYFYVNKISNWENGKTCTVELVKL